MKESGMFALSEPGKLEEVLASAALTPYEDEEIECPIVFADVDAAEHAFMGAGPTQLAIKYSGEDAVSGGRPFSARAVHRHRSSSCFRPGTGRCSLGADPRGRYLAVMLSASLVAVDRDRECRRSLDRFGYPGVVPRAAASRPPPPLGAARAATQSVPSPSTVTTSQAGPPRTGTRAMTRSAPHPTRKAT